MTLQWNKSDVFNTVMTASLILMTYRTLLIIEYTSLCLFINSSKPNIFQSMQYHYRSLKHLTLHLSLRLTSSVLVSNVRLRMIITHLATVCSCDILARFAILTPVLLFHVFRYDVVLLGVQLSIFLKDQSAFKTPGTVHTATQHHIPNDLNIQQTA